MGEEMQAWTKRYAGDQATVGHELGVLQFRMQLWKDACVAFFAGGRSLREAATTEDATAAADTILRAFDARFALAVAEAVETARELAERPHTAGALAAAGIPSGLPCISHTVTTDRAVNDRSVDSSAAPG